MTLPHLPVTSAATWGKQYNFVSKVYKAFNDPQISVPEDKNHYQPLKSFPSLLSYIALYTNSHVKNVYSILSEEIL